MDTRNRMTMLAAVLAGFALVGAGCGEQRTTTTERSGARTTTTTMSAPGEAIVNSDAALTGKVKAAVMAEPGIESLKINVDTKDGVVTLSGTVDSQAHKDRANQVAQNVAGVKSVVDNLTVKTS